MKVEAIDFGFLLGLLVIGALIYFLIDKQYINDTIESNRQETTGYIYEVKSGVNGNILEYFFYVNEKPFYSWESVGDRSKYQVGDSLCIEYYSLDPSMCDVDWEFNCFDR